MSIQTICDLCNKPIIYNSDLEQYKVKKVMNGFGWAYIDVHKSCREKLFNITKQCIPPIGGSSQQKD